MACRLNNWLIVPILAACGLTCRAQKPIWEPGSNSVIHRVSIPVAEGNHRVSVTLGNPDASTTTTIKAELRRLMLDGISTAAGETRTVSFVVNTRRPEFGDGRQVKLKDREREAESIAWDDALTLEFIGSEPELGSIKIESEPDLPTIFLLGDSTMCDQPSEPYASWGQMLPSFFGPGVAVANHGESGESYSTSSSRGRIDKIGELMKPGDYLFLQFAHNDLKERGEGKGAFLNFKDGMKSHIATARSKGGIPVLVTPMHRQRFDDQGRIVNTFGDYPEAVRQTAREERVPLIDLLGMSAELYEALGPDGSAVLFKEGDGTHHNNYGAYQLAKCVVEGIRAELPGAARWLRSDLARFNPKSPDPIDTFNVPPSSSSRSRKPDGE